MALANYTDLKTDIALWITRSGDSNITNQVSDFVTLCEARLNRILPIRTKETDQTLTATISSRVMTPATAFREPISLYRTTNSLYEWMRPFVVGAVAYGIADGVPSGWGVNGQTIELDVPCAVAETFVFRSLGTLALSDTSPTNWLLTNHPDVYLYGSLVQALAFMKNITYAAAWKGAFEEAISEITEQESRSKAMATLTVDEALLSIGSSGAYNINTDQ